MKQCDVQYKIMVRPLLMLLCVCACNNLNCQYINLYVEVVIAMRKVNPIVLLAP